MKPVAVFVLALWWCEIFAVDGFVVLPVTPSSLCSFSVNGIGHLRRSMLLAAKKKRRRRKTVEQAAPAADDSTSAELPDFDLEGEDDAASSQSSSATSRVVDGNTITPNMMSTKQAGGASLGDLLNDRSLEAKFEFDTPEGSDDLPDLLGPQFRQPTAPGKKKARQAARQAAAQARTQEEEFSNPLANLPFLLNEKGEVSGVKILESGAWLGIGLLLLWEVYINSPFFERAAPLIPVVYDILL